MPRPNLMTLLAAALATVAASAAARAVEPIPQPPDGAAAAVPAKLDPKKLIAPKPTPALLEKGKLAFAVSCVVCHGENGAGDGPAGLVLNPRPRDFTKDPFKQGQKPAEIFVSISEGVKDTPMAGWSQLTEEERWGLTYHVLSFVPKAKSKLPKVTTTAP